MNLTYFIIQKKTFKTVGWGAPSDPSIIPFINIDGSKNATHPTSLNIQH